MPVTVLMTAASRKNRINQGKILERRKLPLDFSFSFRERYSARMKVMGMIASVRVSLTIVASVSAVSLPTALLQVVAAATTEEVSFTAVPAHMPKPWSLMPSAMPAAGKRNAANTLKRKIVEMDFATSSSSASMTGAVAAMAEPPQIDEPTPIRMAVFDGICKRRLTR